MVHDGRGRLAGRPTAKALYIRHPASGNYEKNAIINEEEEHMQQYLTKIRGNIK